MSGDDEEPKRLLGFPIERGDWRPRTDDYEPRILGIPSSWFGSNQGQSTDLRWIRHPIRWARWRFEVRRLGPYAPEFRRRGI